MLSRALGNTVKIVAIAAGAGYGFFLGLRANRELGLGQKVEALQAAVEQLKASAVDRNRLTEAVEHATSAISADLDRKFEVQSLAVGSLREMVAQTDLLLMKVLDQLENASLSADEEKGEAVRT